MDTLDSLVAGCGGPRWGWTVSWDPDVERIKRDRTAHRNGVPALILPLVARYKPASEVEVAHRPGRPLGSYSDDPIQRWLGNGQRVEDMLWLVGQWAGADWTPPPRPGTCSHCGGRLISDGGAPIRWYQCQGCGETWREGVA
jgi:hypothetical protein